MRRPGRGWGQEQGHDEEITDLARTTDERDGGREGRREGAVPTAGEPSTGTFFPRGGGLPRPSRTSSRPPMDRSEAQGDRKTEEADLTPHEGRGTPEETTRGSLSVRKTLLCGITSGGKGGGARGVRIY